jgi:predicted dehydrogenase
MRYIHRREFLKTTAALGAGLAWGALGTSARAADAQDPIVVAVMGLGRGGGLAETFAANPGVRLKYVCDVDQKRLAASLAALEKRQKTGVQGAADFRTILDDKEVHALVIAAPDHWHGPATILACAAGKHVYVEKPASHNAREGELMIAAARKHNRVVQVGTQRRSWEKIIEAVQKVHQGVIGKVTFSRGWYTNSRKDMGQGKEVPVPPGLDYTLWQGPAPQRPYRDNLIHYNWHWLWHWGTGELGNNGIHALDLCRWGLDVDYPKRVTSNGGRYHYHDDQETPDTQIVTFDFGDKCLTWEGRSCLPQGLDNSAFGASFYGDQGTLVSNGNGYVIYDLKNNQVAKVAGNGGDAGHIQNFLDCIRTGQRPRADIEHGHKSTLLCHLGNIAQRLGRTINLDPQTGRIANDPDAQILWSREYRPGWEPKVF